MNGLDERTRPPTHARLLLLTVLVIAAAGLTAAVALAANGRHAVRPSVTQPPVISGTATEGSTLNADHGNWDGTAPITYAYSWQRCDKDGGSCSTISGATQPTYVLKTPDNGNTLRVRVTASNNDGNAAATSVPTAVVTATPQPPPTPVTGSPKVDKGTVINISDLTPPARLQIDQFQSTPATILGSSQAFSIRVHISSTCGNPVAGAELYATVVPYNQFSVPDLAPSGSDGWVTLQFSRLSGYPATPRQQLMVMFLRATKPNEDPLAGVSTRRLVSFPVNVKG